MPGEGEGRFRLLRADAQPITNPDGDPFEFGLQDTKQNLTSGVRNADGGLQWDFILRVKPGPDPDHPIFLGPHASGSADDRFVYLSWLSIPRRAWINRLKLRLAEITWAMVHEAQASGRPITVDATGRTQRDSMTPVGWRVGK